MKYNTVWDIFSKLPEKRQKRLEEKLHKMDMEIEISFNEINIIKETDDSILAMVPCVSGDLEKSLYIEYFFNTRTVEISHMLIPEYRLLERIKRAILLVCSKKRYHKKESTVIDLEHIEKLTDFLAAIVEDIYSQLEAEK